MPSQRFIPLGGGGGQQGGFGRRFQGGGRFQPLGGGGAHIPQFFSARQPRFIPVQGGIPRRQGPAPAPTISSPSPLPGLLKGTGGLAGLGGSLAGSPALSGLGGALNIAGGAAALAQGGNNLSKAQDATQIAGGGVTVANSLGADIPYPGPGLVALAGAGEGLAAGSQEGDRAAVRAVMSAFPVVGPVFSAIDLATNLINMGLGEGYQSGDLSKAIMQARQTALLGGATEGVNKAVDAASSYPQILQILGQVPPGTGQLQYGVGAEYTGKTIPDSPDLTQTPGWQQTLAQAQRDPETFIKNFWVQTGQSGAASFDAGFTRRLQTQMIQALPPGDLKTSLLDWASNFGYANPTDPQGFGAATSAYQQWLTGGRQGPSPRQSADAMQQAQQWGRQATESSIFGPDSGSLGTLAPPPAYPDLLSQLGAFNMSPAQAGSLLGSVRIQPPTPPGPPLTQGVSLSDLMVLAGLPSQ